MVLAADRSDDRAARLGVNAVIVREDRSLRKKTTTIFSAEMELVINASILDTGDIDAGYLNGTEISVGDLSWSEAIEEFIYTKLILAVSVFGIGGNLLNLIILSQKSLTYMMERMEKSAHYGLIALAVSDLFFCVATLPHVFFGTGKRNGGFVHASFDFRLAYKLYGNGVINTFSLSSTWLTAQTGSVLLMLRLHRFDISWIRCATFHRRQFVAPKSKYRGFVSSLDLLRCCGFVVGFQYNSMQIVVNKLRICRMKS